MLQQIGVAVTRTRPARGATEPFLPHERIPLDAALVAATSGTAYVSFHDGDSGAIRRGFRADLAVISGDPRTDDLFDLSVAITMLGGDIVHQH